MANTARRVNSYRTERTESRYGFEDGSAARKIYAFPEEEEQQEQQREQRQARRNRVRARNMSVGYVLFLTAVCVASLFLCVSYLQQKATLTTQNETIASMESQLNDLKADNDAYYNQVVASVTLEDVKEAALGRLGMQYADESQIRYYSTGDNSYVRQYMDVPDQE